MSKALNADTMILIQGLIAGTVNINPKAQKGMQAANIRRLKVYYGAKNIKDLVQKLTHYWPPAKPLETMISLESYRPLLLSGGIINK